MSEARLPPRAVAEIDLDALLANLALFRRRLPTATRVIGVVKADAYGHGAVVIAHTLRSAGVRVFGIAALDEAAELRDAGIGEPLWHLGVLLPEEAPAAVALGVTPTLTALDQVEAWAEAVRLRPPAPGPRYPVHLKLDTGMGRRGMELAEAERLWRAVDACGRLRVEGLCTHLATADGDEAFAAWQIEQFLAGRDALAAAGLRAEVVHAANSAGLLRFPAARLDAVRPGIALYGIAAFQAPGADELRPVLRLTARLCQIRDLPAGHEVGYAHGCRLERPTRVGLVSLGYGDGWPWRLSGCGVALAHGVRVPYLGRVNMDLLQLDLNRVPQASVGDTIVLLGGDGGASIGAAELARLAGDSEYAVVTQLGRRVTRVYRRNGRVIAERGLNGQVQWYDE